jgi:hypothetical protein
MTSVHIVGNDGEDLQLPYDPKRRCPVCGCLFGGKEWSAAWVGAVPGQEMLLVMHDDCFKLQWMGQPPQRAFLPVPPEVML